MQWAGSYSGPTDSAALNTATVLNTTGFANAAGGKFGWKLDTDAKTLSLVYTPPPAVAAIDLTGAHSITVTFSTTVSFASGNASAAFQLTNLDSNVNVGLTASVTTDDLGRTVVTLTFSGDQTDGSGNLLSGHYQLSVLSSNVTDANGLALDGSGLSGADYWSQTWTVVG